MALRRIDNVLIVVDDLEAAKAFFVELGMELEGEMPVEGRWVDVVVGLDNECAGRERESRVAGSARCLPTPRCRGPISSGAALRFAPLSRPPERLEVTGRAATWLHAAPMTGGG